jgi:hypothetical protein
MIKKKSRPSNRYTPFDDIAMGIKDDIKQDNPIQDTKHHLNMKKE